MSQSRTITYTCPYCGGTFEAEIYESVHADKDPDLRERCLSGDLFRVFCPHCKHDFMIQFPLVYMDAPHRFVIWLSDQPLPQELDRAAAILAEKGYTLRRCTQLQAFSEKIQILEDGIDDRLVELAKYDSFIECLENKRVEEKDITGVEYQRVENEVMKINVRIRDDRGLSFLIPLAGIRDEFEQDRDLFRIDNRRFPQIDAAWLTAIYKKVNASDVH